MSLGVTERSGENETFDQLFKRADDALYKAKHGGRNQVVVVNPSPRDTALKSRLRPIL